MQAFIFHSCFIAIGLLTIEMQFHAIFQLNWNSIWSFLMSFQKPQVNRALVSFIASEKENSAQKKVRFSFPPETEPCY